MNGKKAKALRKKIFGNFSIRDTKYTQERDGSIRCIGRRKAYQKAKKEKL